MSEQPTTAAGRAPLTARGSDGEDIQVGELLRGHGMVTRVIYPLGCCLSCGRLVDIERDQGHGKHREQGR